MMFYKGVKATQWVKNTLLTNCVKLDTQMQKNEVRPLTYITYRNYLKMNQRPKCKSQNYKTLRRKYWGKAS